MTTPLLQAADLGCTLGHRRLFSGLDFTLDARQWLMLTGTNGSGKSTLLRILAGLVRAESGTVRWRGEVRRAADPLWHTRFVYQGHAAGWKDPLTAAENLATQAALDHGATHDPSSLRDALERVGLARQRNLPYARLSAGQRRRLGLARLVLARRPLWLLDEPTTALDTAGQSLFAGLLDEYLQRGGCAVIATHLAFPTASPAIELRMSEPAPRAAAASAQ